MIDYHAEIVKALSEVLPTYYEMALTNKTKVPCISYMETNNYTVTEPLGANVEYSRLGFQVKIWANDIATIQRYAPNVDLRLRVLGFKRISSGELYDPNSTMIQKILNYEALAIEQIGG